MTRILKKDNPPSDFKRIAKSLGDQCTRTRLKRHYNVGIGPIDGWISKTGVVPVDRATAISKMQTKHFPPEDFVQVCNDLADRNQLSSKNLCDYYNVPHYVIKAWKRLSGDIRFTNRHRMEIPKDFVSKFHSSSGVTELTKHYNVSFDVIKRWMNESHLEFITKEIDINVVESLHKKGLSGSEIGIKLGVPGYTIRNLMNKNGIKNKTNEPLITRKELIDLHHKQKKTQHEIAKITGIHQTTISIYMNKWDIEVKHHKGESGEERIIKHFLEEIIDADRITKRNLFGYEYDIAVMDKNLLIEYNGLRWHSMEYQKNKNSHYNKYKAASKNGYDLITIFADEWYHKSDIVKSIIINRLGLTPNRIYARDCTIRPVKSTEANLFYQENHIQGRTNRNKFNYGLFYNGQLVACMTIGLHPRKNILTLSRYCSLLLHNVVGGGSKLFKHVIDNIDVNEIISWSDNRWSRGDMYKNLGFVLDKNQPPSYSYVHPDKRNRSTAQSKQKSKIGCPSHIKEKDFMAELKYFQIWDCGKKRWVWKRGDC